MASQDTLLSAPILKARGARTAQLMHKWQKANPPATDDELRELGAGLSFLIGFCDDYDLKPLSTLWRQELERIEECAMSRADGGLCLFELCGEKPCEGQFCTKCGHGPCKENVNTALPMGVSVIPYRRGFFAVSQRINKDGSLGLWQFPGGHVEANESTLLAAWRELHEETGLAVAMTRLTLLGQTGPIKGYKGETYIGWRYAFDVENGETLFHTEPEKSTPWQWVNLETLLSLDMLQHTKEFAVQYHKSRTSAKV